MTSGPLLGKILLFALPLILTNLLQMFYNAADMIVVARSSEPDAVGAIGTTGAFTSLVVNLFIGLSVGATVVVARHIGAGEEDRANVAVHTATVVGLVCGVLGAVIGNIIAKPVMMLLGNEGKLLELSVLYVRIYFTALPFHALSNYAIAIHRAKGDTQTPLIVLSAAGILNVGLNLFFVLVCHMSVNGVALATGIAAAASAAVLYINLMRDRGPCRFSFRRLRVDVAEMRKILLIGIPSGVQGALFSVSNMIIQSSIIKVNYIQWGDIERDYQPVVKGNASAANLEGFAYVAINAVSQAAISFTGQNLGANKPERVKRVMGCCYAISAVLAVAITGFFLLFNKPLLALYGVHAAGDELARAAYTAAMTRMTWVLGPYALITTLEMGSGILRGMGKSLTSTVICLLWACVLRIVWIMTVFRYFVEHGKEDLLGSIYSSYPISWVLAGVTQFIVAVVILRRLLRAKREQEAAKLEPDC